MSLLRVAGKVLLAASILASVAGCSISGGTLGGREKCWPEDPPRAASIWRGVLVVDETGSQLRTAEGEAIPLLPGTLTTRIGADGKGELVSGNDVVAVAGEDLTLFGGMGGDGALVVCGLEEVHRGA